MIYRRVTADEWYYKISVSIYIIKMNLVLIFEILTAYFLKVYAIPLF